MRKTEEFSLAMPDGAALRGSLSAGGESAAAPAVVFAHGLGSTRRGEKAAAFEAACAGRGWPFATFDFRGHGASDGTMLDLRGSRLLEDLEAVVRHVGASTGSRICLVGSSMGGWASAWFAARNPALVAACVFIAPAFHFLEWGWLNEGEREEWRRAGRYRVCNEYIDLELDYGLLAEAAHYRFETLTAHFRSPALLFHGLRDEVVPFAESLKFIESCASPAAELVLIKDGDHRLNRCKERMAALAGEFFAAQVGR